MTFAQIVLAAMPDATEADVEHVLWARTPFPFEISARMLYRAASRYKRAAANNIRLCDHCNNPAVSGQWACERCTKALARFRT